MSKLSRTERTGLCLLAVILAAILGILAIRHQSPTAGSEISATTPDSIQKIDSLPPTCVGDTITSKSKNKKKTKEPTRKTAKPPRRHLNDAF